MEIKKMLEINSLLDVYGILLTKKQENIMNMYYKEDLSFGEISEQLEVSRQAVYDTIKKSEQALYSYEKLLKISRREKDIFIFQKKLLEILSEYDKKYANQFTEQEKDDFQKIIKFCKESEI